MRWVLLAVMAAFVVVAGAPGGGGVAARGQAATPAAAVATPCPATTPAEARALVERYWAEVWTAGGEAAVPALLAADELHHWGVGGDTVGHEPFAERLRTFLTAFPDFAVRVDQVVTERDLIVSRYMATATHRGVWQGIEPTGAAVEYSGINLFRIACGRIAESWGEADHAGLLRQIGALPAAPAAATPTP